MLTTLQAARDNAPAATSDLTPRQTDVLQLLAEGLTSKEIADRIGLSTRTVEMHVSRLLQRLHCRTRPEAIRTALERGWLQPSSRSAIGGQDSDA
jgi:DNA-binding NarL/FixJ family response regulator